ncbi:MAG: hypothetical protein IPO08_25040 [Xanthomonadales bacterium]|nr:hypothetical protein [Xanthomonadales bacterium]
MARKTNGYAIRAAQSEKRHLDARDNAVPCTYCGMPADSIDHIPPRAYREFIRAQGLEARYPFIEVMSCRECNSALGARALWTVPVRKRRIAAYLKRKYAKYLRIPDWTPAEAEEMGGGMLGSYIREGLIVRDVTRDRIKRAEGKT